MGMQPALHPHFFGRFGIRNNRKANNRHAVVSAMLAFQFTELLKDTLQLTPTGANLSFRSNNVYL